MRSGLLAADPRHVAAFAVAFASACAPSAPGPVALGPDARAADSGLDDGTSKADATSPDATSPDATSPDATSPDATSPDAGEAVRRVLFIGNSYTYVNDLPGMLASLSTASGVLPRLQTEAVTVGGATLESHWAAGTATARIDEKGFYAVVLQGQSVEPIFPGSSFASYAQRFAERVTATSARALFFGTWARAAGDAIYAEAWSGGTPGGMQDGLTGAYASAATKGKAGLAKVGEAFRRSLAAHPAIALHQADRSHPSAAGTYLAACVFYAILVERPLPESTPVPAGLVPSEAALLRGTALTVAP
jgi:hypothetical protein